MLSSAKTSATQTITYSDKPMFKTANEFSLHIESIVREKRLSYMDAVLFYCKENFLEPADVASLINKSLKDKIEMDFRELNYLPKQAKLDV
jgi:KaiC/GvpD/RAD55 family RecA-like ATPase